MKKYDKPMMKTAHIWAEQSVCERNKVGAVIAKDNRIVSVGYNGTPSGWPTNCCEEDVKICRACLKEMGDKDKCSCGCKTTITTKKTNHNIVIHAEMNAIMWAAKEGVSTNGCTLYVTTSPCANCAKHIVTAGITRVVYAEEYRKTDGLKILKGAGIEYYQTGNN